jgi:hypothetical protein
MLGILSTRWSALGILLSLGLLLGCEQKSVERDEGTAITPDEAKAIAKEAYIFNYPLVMMYRTMYLQAIDTKSKSYSGGFGKWLHLGTSSPKDTDIVSPNNDTPYSYAWVDLRSEPWVLTLPKIEVLNGQYEIPGLVKGK